MAAPKRTDFERERDLAIVADLYLRAHTQQEIADHLNREFYSDRPLSQQQIGYDVRILVTRWQKSAERAIDARKAEELARVDRLEREYWDAWERSQADAEIETLEQIGVKKVKNERGDEEFTIVPERVKKNKRTEGQSGNPAYLAGVQWCINKRCEILGLDAPKKADVTSNGETIKGYAIVSPDDWDAGEK